MGQYLGTSRCERLTTRRGGKLRWKQSSLTTNFPDLANLPPEVAITVLSHLNATDLCLASCVWNNLANAEILWYSLCRCSWGYTSIYKNRSHCLQLSYKKLYMILDEATLTINADPPEGLQYLFDNNLVNDSPESLAKFLHFTPKLTSAAREECLRLRPDALAYFVQYDNYENQFLPNALRNFFAKIRAPNERNEQLFVLIEKFSERFCACNPNMGFSKDAVYVLCFSLIMLSMDLCSPAVRNKMSKREFIKNTQRALSGAPGGPGAVDREYVGHLYDNIYLIGHIAKASLYS